MLVCSAEHSCCGTGNSCVLDMNGSKDLIAFTTYKAIPRNFEYHNSFSLQCYAEELWYHVTDYGYYN